MHSVLDIKARENTIEKVLFANDIFRIPRYQRSYAWGADDVNEFWNDLFTTEKGDLYLGSLTFNCEEQQQTGLIEIIDGQQRLLTITILAAVIRDLARQLGSGKRADKYQNHCIIISHIKYGDDKFRILCSDSLLEYFQKHIQLEGNNILESKTKTPEEYRVKSNYDFLYRKVDDVLNQYVNKSDKENYLQHLIEKVAELQVIDIRTTSEEFAYQIFEGTNARGLELSVGDIVKNTVFKNIPATDVRDFAKEMWTEIENNIPSVTGASYGTDMARFIRYYWLSKYKFVSQKQLYKEIKKEIGSTQWEGFLADLYTASGDYNRFIDPSAYSWADMKHGDEISKSLFALRIMRVLQCNVLLLSIFRNLKRMETDPTRIIQLIEKFHLMYSAVCKLPANKPEDIYSKYAIEIESVFQNGNPKHISGNIQRIFENFKNELVALKPSFEFFVESFNEISYKQSEQSRQLIKYILGEINNLDVSGEHKIDFNVVNIEHILPQTPNKAWGLTKDDIKGYVNKLGNLTLLHVKLNSATSNSPIEEKIEYLRKSEITMNQKLVQFFETNNYEWDEKQINDRHEELAKIAYDKVWNF